MAKLNLSFKKRWLVAFVFSLSAAVLIMAIQKIVLKLALANSDIALNFIICALVSFLVSSYTKKTAILLFLAVLFEFLFLFSGVRFLPALFIALVSFLGAAFFLNISSAMEFADKKLIKSFLLSNIENLGEYLKVIGKNIKISRDALIDILAVDGQGNIVAIGIDDEKNPFFCADILKFFSWVNMHHVYLKNRYKKVFINSKYNPKVFIISNRRESQAYLKLLNQVLVKVFEYNFHGREIIFKEINIDSDNPHIKSTVDVLKNVRKPKIKEALNLRSNYSNVELTKEEIAELLGNNKTKIKH